MVEEMDPFQKFEIGKTGLKVTRLGLGGATLGYLASDLPIPGTSGQRAVASIRRALALGIGYVDTAPFYGNGRSELRFGRALEHVPRESYVISTKVGRLLKGMEDIDFRHITLRTLPKLEMVFDFSRNAILRSFEQSLQRLGLERVDILYLHDPPPEQYQVAINEGYPALAQLRSQGVVKAIGAGMGNLELLIRFAREGDLDCFLLPWRYTLLDQSALSEFLPLCVTKGISIIMASPYDSGRMLGTNPAPPETREQVHRVNAVCGRYGVPIRAAALQFVASHPAMVSVIPGPRSIQEIENNISMMQHSIPLEFWDRLRQESLIPPEAPTPKE